MRRGPPASSTSVPSGYPDGNWPPIEGMSLEANLADLTRHAADSLPAKASPSLCSTADDEVIGCVYLYPPR